MRLIGCHIENFGGLHDRTISFQQGFHVICEENGWGKSALAAFIRVMFYGFGGERKRELKENERKFYTPWQGGAYGGTLTFEAGGKRYVAARTFGVKEAQDTFELRDAGTNLISKDYSAELGKELFGIDRESFLRTVFIGQNQAETWCTDDIHAKVSGITEEAFDMNNYQKARDRLAAVANRLTPRRSTGSIYQKKELAASLRRSVADGAGTESSQQEYQRLLSIQRQEYERCTLWREEIRKGQEEAVRLQNALAKQDEWKRLKADARIWEEKCRAVRGEFPREVPGISELDDCLDKCGKIEEALARESASELNPSETLQLSECERLFQNGVPDPKELEERIGDAGRLLQLRQEMASEQLSLAERGRLQDLEELFGGDREKVSSLFVLWNNRNSKKAALPSNKASLSMLGRALEQEKKRGGAAALLGNLTWILLDIAGILLVLLPIPHFSLLGAVFVLAGIILAAAGFLSRRRKRPERENGAGEYEALQRQVQEDEDAVKDAEERVETYLRAHGRPFQEETVSHELQELSGEYMEYLGLKKRLEKIQESGLAEEIRRLGNGIAAFLGRYGIPAEETGFSEKLFSVKSQAAAYALLKEKRESARRSRRAAEESREELEGFFQKYGLVNDRTAENGMRRRLSKLRDQVIEWQDTAEMAEKARRELEEFERCTDMSVLQREIPADTPTLEEWNQKNCELTEKMDKIQETIRNYLSILEEKQEELERLEEDRTRLEETEEELKKEMQMFSDVQKAGEYLERARDAITNRYTSALMKVFRDSYQAIAKSSADSFHMDANTKMTVDGGGMQREVGSLSAGYRDLVGLCLRIALIGAMYEQEPPMLVMDDPFVNLDDEKVREALGFLETISSRYQVIYFTCSDVRAGGKKEWLEN